MLQFFFIQSCVPSLSRSPVVPVKVHYILNWHHNQLAFIKYYLLKTYFGDFNLSLITRPYLFITSANRSCVVSLLEQHIAWRRRHRNLFNWNVKFLVKLRYVFRVLHLCRRHLQFGNILTRPVKDTTSVRYLFSVKYQVFVTADRSLGTTIVNF